MAAVWSNCFRVLHCLPHHGTTQLLGLLCFLFMLAMSQGQGNLAEYEQKLIEAQAVQAGVLEGVRGSPPDLVAPHRQAAADIQTELALLYSKQQKPKQVPCCVHMFCGLYALWFNHGSNAL